jgi:hypothetical protein
MKWKKGIIGCVLLVMLTRPVCAQQFEAQQLLLNVEKLAQLKQILENLYKGYKVLHDGYTGIKNISEGNFAIHQIFLDGLLSVSPAVKKYKRVGDIIRYQLLILKEGKAAYRQFRQDKHFTAKEIEYMAGVYENLANQSLNNLDDLMLVLTAGKLRMSDDERITLIDRIYSDILEQWSFLKHFNNTTKLLSLARARELQDVEVSRKLSGIK